MALPSSFDTCSTRKSLSALLKIRAISLKRSEPHLSHRYGDWRISIAPSLPHPHCGTEIVDDYGTCSRSLRVDGLINATARALAIRIKIVASSRVLDKQHLSGPGHAAVERTAPIDWIGEHEIRGRSAVSVEVGEARGIGVISVVDLHHPVVVQISTHLDPEFGSAQVSKARVFMVLKALQPVGPDKAIEHEQGRRDAGCLAAIRRV